jgi:hypothetical protein
LFQREVLRSNSVGAAAWRLLRAGGTVAAAVRLSLLPN